MFGVKVEHAVTGWTVPLLANNHFSQILFARLNLTAFLMGIVSFTVEEHNHIRILLYRSRISEIRELGTFVLSGLHCTRELGQYHQRDIKFACKRLEIAANLAHLLYTVL